jgi:hypothetical protein
MLPLIGVVIGGFLTGGVQLLLAHHRSRADARVAARLFLMTLLDLQGTVRILADGVHGPGAVTILDECIASWKEHRPALASSLSADDVLDLGITFLGVGQLRSQLDQETPNGEHIALVASSIDRRLAADAAAVEGQVRTMLERRRSKRDGTRSMFLDRLP